MIEKPTYEDLLHRVCELEQEVAVYRQEQGRAQQYLDVVGVMLIALNAAGEITLINQKGCKILNVRESEALGKNWFEHFLPPNMVVEIKGVFSKLMAGNIDPVEYYENSVLTGSRDEKIIAFHNTLLSDEDGNINGILFSGEDITEAKQAEELLKEQVNLLSLSSQIGLLLTTKTNLRNMLQSCCEAQVRYLNAAFARIWTINQEENILNLQASAGMYTHIDGKHSSKPLDESSKIGRIAIQKAPHLTNNVIGDPKIIDQEWAKREGITAFAGHPLLIDNEVVGVMGMFSRNPLSDITLKALATIADGIALGIDRQKTNEKIKTAFDQFKTMMDSLDSLVYVADMETYSILFVNKYGRDIWGDIIGKTCWQALQEGQRGPCTFCTNNKLLDADGKPGEAIVWDFQNTVNNHWYECRDQAIRWTDGRFVRMEIATDITERKRAEEEKNKLESLLQQSQKMEAIGTLAGGIAHDLNNILVAIFGYAELAKAESDNPARVRQDLNMLLKGANRAKNLVRQILAFSRSSAHELRPLKVQLIVKEALKLLHSSIPTTIEFKEEINQDCKTILADPTQIHQVVMNLCTNAYHAMREKGGILGISLNPVELSSQDLMTKINLQPGSYIKLEVSDTGPGMSKEVQTRIFEPYFTTKRKGEGTGLGLAVVHGIVCALQGNITVCSELEKGTSFNVYLPVSEGVTESVQDQGAPPFPTGNERILLVDDDEVVLDVNGRTLKQLGYKVIASTSSEDSLLIFQKKSADYDLVITDMTMPKMTGADLAQQILAIRPEMPIILCTGFSELIDKEKAEALGIKKYIMKPVLKRELAEAVRQVLDENKA